MKQRLCCSCTISFNRFFTIRAYLLIFVGHGGTLVESMPLDRKVVGSNLALSATPGTLGKSVTCIALYCIVSIGLHLCSASCSAHQSEALYSDSACKLRHSVNWCGWERLR